MITIHCYIEIFVSLLIKKGFNFANKGSAIVGGMVAQGAGKLNYNQSEIKSFCETNYSAAASSTESRVNIQTASKIIANAWESCMQSDGANFSYKVTPDNKQVSLRFVYRSANTDTVELKTRWFQKVGFTISPKDSLGEDCPSVFYQQFTNNDVTATCDRTDSYLDKDVVVTVSTKKHGDHTVIIPKQEPTDEVPDFIWVRTDTKLIGKNQNGVNNEPSQTCLKFESFESLIVHEEAGHGIVNLEYTCLSPTNGSNAKQQTTNNLNGTKRKAISCPKGYSPRGVKSYTESGFGVVDMSLYCKNAKNQVVFSNRATRNENAQRSYVAECPQGQRFAGIQPRYQGGPGIVNMRLICQALIIQSKYQ